MKLPIICPCGAALRVDVRLAGQPLVCPACGSENMLTTPVAGIPEPAPVSVPAPKATVELPSWIVVPILGYLMLVGGVIVLVGWWIAQPVQEPAVNAPILVEEKPPLVAQTPVSEEPEPAALKEPEFETRPSESFVLPRRMPTGNTEAPVLRPLEPMPNAVAPAAPVSEKSQPIKWAIEKPVGGLIPMVEISSRASADLLYSVRRLRLPDDAGKPLRLAVTPAGHDDIGNILTRMGDGYRFSTLRNLDLLSLEALQAHDVIFLTCADLFAQDFQAVLPLRKFVEQGGTLYASDLRGDMVLAAFPEFRARGPIWPGVPQRVEASVVEPGLQSYLQRKTIPLVFEAPGWRPAAFDPKKVTVCLQGTYRNMNGQTANAPLLVKFRVQQGTVIFTSFHHAKNDTAIVRKLLDYLAFASVSARSEARLRAFMQRYDFAPQDLRPTLLTAGQKADATYQHPGGGLQIAIGFEHQQAKLKLTLHSPTGQSIEHDDQGIFLIDVPNAPAGAWRYTVTPIELPHDNFPSVVAVGAGKS
jgi:hypothetical protein